MALQNFVDYQGPVISAAWLNAVDQFVNGGQGVVSATQFGADPTGVADSTAAINAAIVYAAALNNSTVIDTPTNSNIRLGGAVVFFPPGVYLCSSGSINLPIDVSLVGSGYLSSYIHSTFNGQIISCQPSAAGVYAHVALLIRDLGIIGTRANNLQDGLCLLRPNDALILNVRIQNCGRDGLLIREGITSTFQNVRCFDNVGAGIHVGDGLNSWAGNVPDNQPSNQLIFDECHSGWNDGAGLLLDGVGTTGLGFVNECLFIGCTFEQNYYSSSSGTGYNVEDHSNSYLPNTLQNCAFEGQGQFHVFKTNTAANISATLNLICCTHGVNGAGTFPLRFAYVAVGTIYVENCAGTNNLYPVIGGSTAPIRVNKAGGNARVDIINMTGCGLTQNGPWVEDTANATTGLSAVSRSNIFDRIAGPASWNVDQTAVWALDPNGAKAATLTGVFATGAAAPTLTVISNTIAPTAYISFVGAGLVKTITAPAGFGTGGGVIGLIPAAAGPFTVDTTGNIAVASTPIVGKIMWWAYDSGTSKWYPSY